MKAESLFRKAVETPPDKQVNLEYDTQDKREKYWSRGITLRQGENSINLHTYFNGLISFGPRPGTKEFAALGKALIFDPLVIEKDQREIWTLLHEVGHVVSNQVYEDLFKRNNAGALSKASRDRTQEEHQNILKEERDAWANAIWIARDLRKNHNIDLFSMFDSSNALMLFLRERGLDSYYLLRLDEGYAARIMRRFFSRRVGLTKEFLGK